MSKELPREVLVSPVVSLDDIEEFLDGQQLEPATEHNISGYRQPLYQGNNPEEWLTEHGYTKVADVPMAPHPRTTEVDGWYTQ